MFSVAWHVADILAKAPMRRVWLTADARRRRQRPNCAIPVP